MGDAAFTIYYRRREINTHTMCLVAMGESELSRQPCGIIPFFTQTYDHHPLSPAPCTDSAWFQFSLDSGEMGIRIVEDAPPHTGLHRAHAQILFFFRFTV